MTPHAWYLYASQVLVREQRPLVVDRWGDPHKPILVRGGDILELLEPGGPLAQVVSIGFEHVDKDIERKDLRGEEIMRNLGWEQGEVRTRILLKDVPE